MQGKSWHVLKQMVKMHVKKTMPVVAAINQKKKAMEIMKAGYFDVKGMKDVKAKDDGADMLQMAKEIELLENELKLATQAIRAGLGDRPIRMRLSKDFVITTTVTSGVTNTVTVTGGTNAILPSNATEWATCALLFDEYKMFGGHVEFYYANANVGNGAATNITVDNIPVMGYETDGSTAATGSLLLTQLAQHKIFHNTTAVNGIGNSFTSMSSTHRFDFHLPKGTAIGGSDGLNVDPGTEWIVVTNPVAGGYIKFYHVGVQATAVNSGAGVLFYDLEFRCRV